MQFCSRKQLSTPALAASKLIQSYCLHYVIAHEISYYSIYKILPWDDQWYSPYETGLLLVLKLFAILFFVVTIFDDCIIKTISSDAESHEEQDGGKHLFVG